MEGLKHKVKVFCYKKMFLSGRVQSKLVHLKGITDMGPGRETQPPDIFAVLGGQISDRWVIFVILKENCQFNVIQIKSRTFLKPLKKTILLGFSSQLMN